VQKQEQENIYRLAERQRQEVKVRTILTAFIKERHTIPSETHDLSCAMGASARPNLRSHVPLIPVAKFSLPSSRLTPFFCPSILQTLEDSVTRLKSAKVQLMKKQKETSKAAQDAIQQKRREVRTPPR
jgi:hypothetical protein